MSIKGALLAEGNTAEVFAWGDTHVLKLYRANYSSSAAEREANLVQAVIEAGVATPAVTETVTLNDRVGLLFARIDGPTMFKALLGQPSDVPTYAHLLAELHYKLHKLANSALPDLHERLYGRLQQTPHEASIPTSTIHNIQALLDQLPRGDALCHGDFGPHNVLMTDNGPVIIDWVDATRGEPAADVARTMLLMKHAVLPMTMDDAMRTQITQMRSAFGDVYLAKYMELTGLLEEEVTRWTVPIAAGRVLDEDIPAEEVRTLLGIIDAGLT